MKTLTVLDNREPLIERTVWTSDLFYLIPVEHSWLPGLAEQLEAFGLRVQTHGILSALDDAPVVAVFADHLLYQDARKVVLKALKLWDAQTCYEVEGGYCTRLTRGEFPDNLGTWGPALKADVFCDGEGFSFNSNP